MSIVGDLSQKVRRCIMDAPIDGRQYARKDGSWSEVSAGTVGATPALFVKPVRGKPLLEKTGVTSVKIPAGLSAAVGSKLVTLSSAITLTLASNLVGSVAEQYSITDEIKLLRTAPSHEFDVYNDHAEACRQWGREQKALLGL